MAFKGRIWTSYESVSIIDSMRSISISRFEKIIDVSNDSFGNYQAFTAYRHHEYHFHSYNRSSHHATPIHHVKYRENITFHSLHLNEPGENDASFHKTLLELYPYHIHIYAMHVKISVICSQIFMRDQQQMSYLGLT